MILKLDNVIDESNEYKNGLYKRGYLLSYHKIEGINCEWLAMKLGEYHIYYDSLNDVFFYESNGKWAFLLGSVIDLKNNTDNYKFICKKIIDCLNISLEKFYNYLDYLSGRYVIIFFDGVTRVLTDATGMKSVVYDKTSGILGSHANLIANIVNPMPYNINGISFKQMQTAIIGNQTKYDGIMYLIPNTLLELETKTVKRFFPREDIAELDVEKVVEELDSIMSKQMELVMIKYKNAVFSLTAGMDSRFTLTFLKPYLDNVDFFTYYAEGVHNSKKSLDIDRIVGKEIGYNLNLKHSEIALEYDGGKDELNKFSEVLKENTIRGHHSKLAKFYYDKFPHETLHIRSNLAEIGRAFYRDSYKKYDFNQDNKILLTNFMANNKKYPELVEIITEEYCEIVQLDKIYNYDVMDLFYWEYRMGTWHSQVLIESDMTHDTHIIFNSRLILKLLLSVPLKDRMNHTVFKKIIQKKWPILDYWPINSLRVKNEKSINKDVEDDYGMYLKGVTVSSGNIYKPSEEVYFEENRGKKKISFNMTKTNPMKGEYVQAEIPLDIEGNKQYEAVFNLRSSYRSKVNKGRLKYQVFLGDRLLLEEDIASWSETNVIRIVFKSRLHNNKIKIRVIAMKNCEAWSWGQVSKMYLERLVVRETQIEGFILSFSSPYSDLKL